MSDQPTIIIDPEVLDAARGAQVILTGTDEGDDPALERERRGAATLAAEVGATLVLFDRSQQTWGDTDYEQLYALDEVEAAGREHLCAQMREALAVGVPEVKAWGYALPALESLGRAIEAVGADVVVTPAELENPTLAERWFLNRDLPGRVAEQAGGRPVVVIEADGRMHLAPGHEVPAAAHGTEGGMP